MLLGEFQHSLDQKGRVAVPAKFRSNFAEGAVITRGLDKCLFVFSSKEWRALAEKLTSLPLAQSNSRAFARLMLAGAVDVSVDAQGRILVPDYLRKYAGLEREVTVAGLYNRAEIWDREKWNEYKKKTEESSEDIAEKLSELGI